MYTTSLGRSNSSPSVHSGQPSSKYSESKAGLANFAKLSISMSYKNRTSMFVDGSRESVLMDGRHTDEKSIRMSTASTYCSSRDSNSSLNTVLQRPVSEKVMRPSIQIPIPTTIAENPDVTDAEIKKMQTKRALRRMCLEMNLAEADEDSQGASEDEDNEDSDDSLARKLYQMKFNNEEDSDEEDELVRNFNQASTNHSSDTVTISKKELRQFQTRLQQLEDLCAEQAEKQADLENNIERE
ncbi:hypothetical protein THRCLA_10969, partial [Thraustotheca clavata]